MIHEINPMDDHHDHVVYEIKTDRCLGFVIS